MKFIIFPLSLLVIVFIQGCNNPSDKNTSPSNTVNNATTTVHLGDDSLLIEYGESQIPKTISRLDADLSKAGYEFEYGENGGLKKISHWENGILQGETRVFKDGFIPSSQMFDSGQLIYSRDYSQEEIEIDRLYPSFLEEFFFEDKYYAKINFPQPYPGELQVNVKDFHAVISSLPQQTFQLVINDALDLSQYTLALSYQPAAKDTLMASEYTYTHVVFSD